jgi:hypothetical protein
MPFWGFQPVKAVSRITSLLEGDILGAADK